MAAELLKGNVYQERGQQKLAETRKEVIRGWSAVERQLAQESELELASDVRRFIGQMQPPWTERMWVTHRLRQHLSTTRSRDLQPTR